MRYCWTLTQIFRCVGRGFYFMVFVIFNTKLLRLNSVHLFRIWFSANSIDVFSFSFLSWRRDASNQKFKIIDLLVPYYCPIWHHLSAHRRVSCPSPETRIVDLQDLLFSIDQQELPIWTCQFQLSLKGKIISIKGREITMYFLLFTVLIS